MARELQIPVVVTVNAVVDDEGAVKILNAYPDSDGGPWAYSGDPVAYELGEVYDWHEQAWSDEDVVAAWNAAYEEIEVQVVEE